MHEVQHSVQAYDSKERLRKLNKDLADAEAMFQQQLMQAGTTAQQNVDAEVPSIQSSVLLLLASQAPHSANNTGPGRKA